MEKSDYVSALLLNIEKICSSSNLPAAYIETESGVGKGLIGNLKKGSAPSVDKVAKLADFLGVSTDYLLGRTETPDGEYHYNNGDNSIQAIKNSSVTVNNNNRNDEEVREIELILNKLTLRERTELLTMIYKFTDECKKQSKGE